LYLNFSVKCVYTKIVFSKYDLSAKCDITKIVFWKYDESAKIVFSKSIMCSQFRHSRIECLVFASIKKTYKS